VVTVPHAIHGHGAFSQTLRQGALVIAAVTLYFGVRGATEANPGPAMRNAGRLMALEDGLHVNWEHTIQQTVGAWPPVATAFNWIYIYGHWPVIAVSLGWLALRHPDVFTRARNAILMSGGIGLLVFMTVPVAPPRLADPALVDTVTAQNNAYRVLQPAAFTNQYAALPSLHVGWNLIISLAVMVAVRRVLVCVLAVSATVLMDLAVVVTANHYVIDVVVGAALATGAWLAAGRIARTGRRRVPPTVVERAAFHRATDASQADALFTVDRTGPDSAGRPRRGIARRRSRRPPRIRC
jgi:membrane-associated phospholipid phosphatase